MEFDAKEAAKMRIYLGNESCKHPKMLGTRKVAEKQGDSAEQSSPQSDHGSLSYGGSSLFDLLLLLDLPGPSSGHNSSMLVVFGPLSLSSLIPKALKSSFYQHAFASQDQNL